MLTELQRIREGARMRALSDRFVSMDQVRGSARRIGVPALDFDTSVSTHETPPGFAVHRVPGPLWRRFTSLLGPRLPEPGGTVFCESWDDVAHVVGALEQLRPSLELVGLSPGAIEAELDNLRKAVLETGRSGDGHVSVEGITNEADVPLLGAREFGIWLESRVGLLGRDGLDEWSLDLSVVKGTSHGWPSYVPGSDPGTNVDLLGHVWLAGWLSSLNGDIAALDAAFREEIGSPGAPVSALMFSRTGPLAKPTPHFSLPQTPGDEIIQIGSSVGAFCRERQVFAVPTCVNLFLRAASVKVKTLLRTSYSFKHGDAGVLQSTIAGLPHLKFISEDISGFDRSVTRRMQRDLASQVYSRFLSGAELRAYDQLQTMGVLAPALDRESEGFLYSRSGMTISGSIFTTNDGTIINASSIGYSVARALDIPLEDVWALKGRRWDLLVLGDDCVIGFDTWNEAVRSAYLTARAESGFKTDVYDGVVFLMTAVSEDASLASGILSRAVSKSVFREHPSRSFFVDMFGLYNRWARCKTHPLFSLAWETAIASSPAGGRLGLRNFSVLETMVNHPSFVRSMLKEADDVSVRASLRDLLTGIGHGDLVEGLELLPASFAFMGGALREEMLSTTSMVGHLFPAALERQYLHSRPLWRAYFKRRLGGEDVSSIASGLGMVNTA